MWDGVEDVGKNTEIYVLGRLFNDFGPKLVQKVPYGSGVSENGVGFKKNAFPDRQIAIFMSGPKFVRFTISYPVITYVILTRGACRWKF